MTGNDSTSSTSSTRAYQGVKIYDGTDPTAYKPWRAKILSHYGTWLNGEHIAGIWQEHIVDDGVFTASPNAARDEAFLAKFRPHLSAGFLNCYVDHRVASRQPPPCCFINPR